MVINICRHWLTGRGTFHSATDGTFHSDMPGTFESDMSGTFKVLQSHKAWWLIWSLWNQDSIRHSTMHSWSTLTTTWIRAYSGARSASNSGPKRWKWCSITYKKQVKYEQKSTGRALIFRSIVGHHSISAKRRHFRHIHSGAMSAIVKIQQAVCQSFPEYGRPHICRITYLCHGNNR